MARRVYWVGLYLLVKRLCDYWNRYSNKMPGNLPSSVVTAMAALNIACSALAIYDANTVPGRPETD